MFLYVTTGKLEWEPGKLAELFCPHPNFRVDVYVVIFYRV
jgi:hypothetical protein